MAAPVFDGAPLAGSERERSSVVLHGLYWLTADLSEEAPLALLVDDAQWVDAASARFLVYLARRIEAVPVLLVVAHRSGEAPSHRALADELAALAAGTLRPRPLSETASGRLVRGVLGVSVATAPRGGFPGCRHLRVSGPPGQHTCSCGNAHFAASANHLLAQSEVFRRSASGL